MSKIKKAGFFSGILFVFITLQSGSNYVVYKIFFSDFVYHDSDSIARHVADSTVRHVLDSLYLK